MFKNISKNSVVLDGVVLALIGLFLLWYFKPALLLLKTTINGGDTGSHYPVAVYLKEILLPRGKIMGWMPGNYAGFPLFYHYFPLPFLLMACLSYFIPMEISFKLISVVGIFLLPLTVYLAFRFLKYEFPLPIFAAIFSLPFLFNQGNSMWGGNIPSTLAGEFSYSLGFALAFLLLGSLYRGVAEKKYLLFNTVLLFLIGLSHAYALIFSLLLASFFIFDDFKNNVKYLLAVYGLGLLLLSFWLVPVLFNLPYTTSFVVRWTISSIFKVVPVPIIPFVIFSLVAFYFNRQDKRTFYFIYLLLACLVLYLIGPSIKVLDIRFIPFGQLMLTVFGATLISRFTRRIKLVALLPLLALFLIMLWVDANTTYIRHWISWNYSGYETKPTWPVFKEIGDYLRKSGPGRVEWEHTPLDEKLGSIRTSETLPYFAGRETLEGIHMLGAVSAPFVFYIESETSYQPCNPLPQYFYSTFDLKRGIDHFKLFNVSHFVARTPQVKKAIKKYPEFKLEKTVAEYEIYRLTTNNNRYVEPLANQPVYFKTNNWKDIAYQWFARGDLQDLFLVFNQGEDIKQTADSFAGLKKIPYPPKKIKVSSQINNEAIDIETSAIGRPLLIKVSYHPNWKVAGADKIYLVSPCFMLIYPESRHVRLTFEPGWPDKAGGFLSLLGLAGVLLAPVWSKRIV